MMTKQELEGRKQTAVENALRGLDYELIDLWNENADADDLVYQMYQLDEFMENDSPTEIALRVFHGDFNPNDDYFCFNGYANLVSFSYLEDKNCPVDLSDLTDRVMEDGCDQIGNEDLVEDFLDAAGLSSDITADDACEWMDSDGVSLLTEDWGEVVDSMKEGGVI